MTTRLSTSKPMSTFRVKKAVRRSSENSEYRVRRVMKT